MYERFWREHADCEAVVAVGGGSAIDTAKALMVGTASGRFDELVALLATRQAVHAAPRQVADRRADDGGHRQRGHAVGDDLGPRRRQEAFAAPAARPGPRRRSSIPT